MTPVLSQGIHLDFEPEATHYFDGPPQRQFEDHDEDVQMLPAYTEVVDVDRLKRPRRVGNGVSGAQYRDHERDRPVAGPSRLPALDLLFVSSSDTGDILARLASCLEAVRPVELVSGVYLSFCRLGSTILIGAGAVFAVTWCLHVYSWGPSLSALR